MLHTVYQFGRFAMDTGAHCLLKDGMRLPIQEQPFQVLQALLESPGQVVTRETLRMRLWGTDTFVDFDQSLNSAVRRLRIALEDNSREPIYIETIPRVGFRFLMAVSDDRAALKSFDGQAEMQAPVDRPAQVKKPVMQEPLPQTREARFSARGFVVGCLALVLGLLLGVSAPRRFATDQMRCTVSAK